jgi:hypothetical protein
MSVHNVYNFLHETLQCSLMNTYEQDERTYYYIEY